jgi:hypothetical protein
MSVLSGIGQIPPVFSSGSSGIVPPVIVALPLQNNGASPAGVGDFDSYLFAWNGLLQSYTTYKVFFTLSVVSGTGRAQYASLGSSTTVQFQFNAPSGTFNQNINCSPNVTMGTLIVSGQITTPNLSFYSSIGALNITASWSYPTDDTAPLYTSGIIYFEPA